MIEVREATGGDAEEITKIFRACYGDDYSYPQYFDAEVVRKLIYSDDTLLLVAEDRGSGELLGTASVIYSIGANSDLTGEFGRLAVRPEARAAGIGSQLMKERLARVGDRLHVALIDGRVVHPYSQRIAESHGFSAVGFLPMKLLLAYRESVALFASYGSDALRLRNNHPRVIPEIYPLASCALTNCGLDVDVIVDESAPSYVRHNDQFVLSEMETEGYSSVLRIERGRVRNREIFGPVRLHYGFFKLRTRNSQYLVARRDGQIVGAVGFTIDTVEKAARIFELISLSDEVIGTLISEAERVLREERGVEFIEVDVSAYAPRMQRTLLELNFVPAAYVPALVFHEVERLDAVKMVRLTVPLDLGPVSLTETARAVADIVLKGFDSQRIAPRIAETVETVSIFNDFTREQINRLAAVCQLRKFERGSTIFEANAPSSELYLVIDGEVSVSLGGRARLVGTVRTGECLGETALLTGDTYSVSAIAETDVEAATLSRDDLAALVRRRPDIGVLIYRNLAIGLGEKLRRADRSATAGPTAQ